MKDPDNRKYSRERKRAMRLQYEGRCTEGWITEDWIAEQSAEENPAVERGERFATGKIISRGGKSFGDVQGATSNSNQWTKDLGN